MRAEVLDDFLRNVGGNDVWFTLGRKRYFINGATCTFDKLGRTISATLSVHELDVSDAIVMTLFTVTKTSPYECVAAFINDFKINGKSIFDLRQRIKWEK